MSWYVILQILHETALVETFNLKAAIEYQLKNCTLVRFVINFNNNLQLNISISQMKQLKKHSQTCLQDQKRYYFVHTKLPDVAALLQILI